MIRSNGRHHQASPKIEEQLMATEDQPTNPVLPQDRVDDLFTTFQKYDRAMFHQQRTIYHQLVERVIGKQVLEVGCGVGLGSGMLARPAAYLLGTDAIARNITFAKEIYPWIPFEIWDVEAPRLLGFRPQVIVAVEVIEHVSKDVQAMKHLLRLGARDLWISTPNGGALGKTVPPSNPHHVREYRVSEFFHLVEKTNLAKKAYCYQVTAHSWENLEKLVSMEETEVDPIVYHLQRKD